MRLEVLQPRWRKRATHRRRETAIDGGPVSNNWRRISNIQSWPRWSWRQRRYQRTVSNIILGNDPWAEAAPML